MARRETRHRILALSLVLTFSVFNVGIPVVLDACPMPTPVGSMKCTMCHEGNTARGGAPELRSPSCCSPVLVAEGNSAEFLQSASTQATAKAPVAEVFAPVAASALVPALISRCAVSNGSPPLVCPDLTILHSALLI